MTDALTGQAPAKLNLFLHVIGRRADGYHEIQTAFQFIDLCDTVRMAVRDDGEIVRRQGPPGIPADADLAIRAAHRLKAASGTRLGADLSVDKRIPVGAGLGGGSSDAAAVLVLLNRSWRLDWSLERLAGLGIELGADVPVFVHGRAAWAEGIGERLTPIEPPEPWYLVIDPGIAVATRELYQSPDLTRDSAGMTIPDFVSGGGGNVFEPLVRARHPGIGAALDWLGAHGAAKLTGTGACVYAAFETEGDARAVCGKLPAQWRGFVARGLNRSPLHLGA